MKSWFPAFQREATTQPLLGLEDAVDATYSFLRMIYSEESAYMMSVFGTDTHTNGADGGWKSFNYYDNGLNAGAAILRSSGPFFIKVSTRPMLFCTLRYSHGLGEDY